MKVLRPGVEEAVAADLDAYRRILRFLDRVWGHPHIKREITVEQTGEYDSRGEAVPWWGMGRRMTDLEAPQEE